MLCEASKIPVHINRYILHYNSYPDNGHSTRLTTLDEITKGCRVKIPVWEQLSSDPEPWQVVPRKVFTS